jgi:hypothetical protein
MLPGEGPTRKEVLRAAVNIAKRAVENRPPDPSDVAIIRSVAPAEMRECTSAELAHYLVGKYSSGRLGKKV